MDKTITRLGPRAPVLASSKGRNASPELCTSADSQHPVRKSNLDRLAPRLTSSSAGVRRSPPSSPQIQHRTGEPSPISQHRSVASRGPPSPTSQHSSVASRGPAASPPEPLLQLPGRKTWATSTSPSSQCRGGGATGAGYRKASPAPCRALSPQSSRVATAAPASRNSPTRKTPAEQTTERKRSVAKARSRSNSPTLHDCENSTRLSNAKCPAAKDDKRAGNCSVAGQSAPATTPVKGHNHGEEGNCISRVRQSDSPIDMHSGSGKEVSAPDVKLSTDTRLDNGTLSRYCQNVWAGTPLKPISRAAASHAAVLEAASRLAAAAGVPLSPDLCSVTTHSGRDGSLSGTSGLSLRSTPMTSALHSAKSTFASSERLCIERPGCNAAKVEVPGAMVAEGQAASSKHDLEIGAPVVSADLCVSIFTGSDVPEGLGGFASSALAPPSSWPSQLAADSIAEERVDDNDEVWEDAEAVGERAHRTRDAPGHVTNSGVNIQEGLRSFTSPLHLERTEAPLRDLDAARGLEEENRQLRAALASRDQRLLAQQARVSVAVGEVLKMESHFDLLFEQAGGQEIALKENDETAAMVRSLLWSCSRALRIHEEDVVAAAIGGS